MHACIPTYIHTCVWLQVRAGGWAAAVRVWPVSGFRVERNQPWCRCVRGECVGAMRCLARVDQLSDLLATCQLAARLRDLVRHLQWRKHRPDVLRARLHPSVWRRRGACCSPGRAALRPVQPCNVAQAPAHTHALRGLCAALGESVLVAARCKAREVRCRWALESWSKGLQTSIGSTGRRDDDELPLVSEQADGPEGGCSPKRWRLTGV